MASSGLGGVAFLFQGKEMTSKISSLPRSSVRGCLDLMIGSFTLLFRTFSLLRKRPFWSHDAARTILGESLSPLRLCVIFSSSFFPFRHSPPATSLHYSSFLIVHSYPCAASRRCAG